METRIQEILQRLQDLSNDQSPKSLIDLDLMLDYTRVLYADLIALRKNTPVPTAHINKVETTTEQKDIQTQYFPDEPTAASIPDTAAPEEPLEQDTPELHADIPEEAPLETHTAESDDDEIIETLKSKAESAISFEPPAQSAAKEPEHLSNTLEEEAPAQPAAPPHIMHQEDVPHQNKDIRKVIGINDKFLFLNELFNNHKTEYENTLDEINRLGNFDAALQWLQAKSASKTVWDEESGTVQNFIAVLKKHFSVIK